MAHFTSRIRGDASDIDCARQGHAIRLQTEMPQANARAGLANQGAILASLASLREASVMVISLPMTGLLRPFTTTGASSLD
jgi:hypothetical protein